MKRYLVMITMLILPVLSFYAKGKPWSKKLIRQYIKDEKVVELIVAANKGKVKKIDELVSKGADVNYRGKDNYTPLYIQMFSLNLKGFKSLLEHGADPNIPVADGSSVIWAVALGGAVSDETLPMLRLCLEHGGNPNWTYHKASNCINDDGRTLMMEAALYNKNAIEALKLLLAAGADINARDNFGQTALILAADGSSNDVVWFLLNEGADFAIKDVYGYTFLDSLENAPLDSYNGMKGLKEQFRWREKVIDFLKQKGIEVHLKYPKLEDGTALNFDD